MASEARRSTCEAVIQDNRFGILSTSIIRGNIKYYLPTEDGEPSIFHEAIYRQQASLWFAAMQK